jgi:hypothetical protein
MDWEPKRKGSVSSVSSSNEQKNENLLRKGGPVSTVSSLDKQKGTNQMPKKGSVSTVSSSDKDFLEKKKDLKMLFYRTDSTDTTRNNSNLTIQRTDTTDRTLQVIAGYTIARIIWETDKAIVFVDEQGQFWRFLHAYGQAWPFVVSKSDMPSDRYGTIPKLSFKAFFSFYKNRGLQSIDGGRRQRVSCARHCLKHIKH